ncbi:transcriptional regulator YeiL [Solibacillus sp. FSL W8-0372]|uniref:transcriptional regulator YeiL n=1 Tax=Solibacillus sp. FSL W8-0372 TaxID=2921713 RepID=UPI0030D44B3D
MRKLSLEESKPYIEQYPISQYFSFDINPFIQVYEFDKGEYIFHEHSFPDYLYYMIEGKAKLYVTHKNGKISLIDFITSPTFMGEMELLNAERYSKGIQTVTTSICFAISIREVKEKLLADPVFLKMLCLFLSQKTMDMTAKYTQNQAYPLENRLASFILLSSDKQFYKEKHTEVCEYLGVSYRHLLFVLAQFCEEGYLTKKDRGYVLKNRQVLEKLASEITY